jgi:hypothetical protein
MSKLMKWNRFLDDEINRHNRIARIKERKALPPIPSTIFAAFKQDFDFVVISQERDKKIGGPVLEDKTPGQAAAAFKKVVPQFTDGKPAVAVGLTEAFG